MWQTVVRLRQSCGFRTYMYVSYVRRCVVYVTPTTAHDICIHTNRRVRVRLCIYICSDFNQNAYARLGVPRRDRRGGEFHGTEKKNHCKRASIYAVVVYCNYSCNRNWNDDSYYSCNGKNWNITRAKQRQDDRDKVEIEMRQCLKVACNIAWSLSKKCINSRSKRTLWISALLNP